MAGLLFKPEGLSPEQKRHLEAFLQFCPKARQLRKLALQFRAMLRWRKAERLKAWMEKAVASEFFFLAQFARTLHRDLDAVTLGITTPWNNGPLEGHINRLKINVWSRGLRSAQGPSPAMGPIVKSCTESA